MGTPFHLLNRHTRRRIVNEVRVHGVGQSLGWDCTSQQIADVLGLNVRTVQDICRARGWTPKGEHQRRSERPDLDVLFAAGAA